MLNNLFEQALHLSGPWFIEKLDFSAEDQRLDIHVNFRRGSLFDYECVKDQIKGRFKPHDTVIKSWRHLNFFEYDCYLHCRVPRIRTDNGTVRLIKTPWEGKNSGFTQLFEALLLELCNHMPIDKVATLMGLNDDLIWRLLHKYVEDARAAEDWRDVSQLGLDETSKGKHHDYVTVFVDMKKKKTLFVTPGKDNTTVKSFVEELENHGGKAENISDVSSDMSPAFIKGVSENLPEADITFDRFHVMKIINKAVNKVRIEEAKQNKDLAGTKYLFLSNRENLSDEQQAKLKQLELPRLRLKSARALHIREAFQALYEVKNKTAFEYELQRWYSWARRCRLEPIKDAAATIKKHWDGVLRWFDSKLSNGLLEGINSIIQAAKNRAKGYKTDKNFCTIIYLLTAKLDFKNINQHCGRFSGQTHSI